MALPRKTVRQGFFCLEDEMYRLGLSVGLGIILAGCAVAQDAAPTAPSSPPPPPPPCEGEAYHQFDFWVGDWSVTATNGQFAGTNAITREEAGCLLLETWTSAGGTTGQSYNYYNPDTDKWRQVWVSAGALIDYEGGLTETGSMKLTGTITYHGTAQSAPFTGEWTLNEDGTVTQHFEQYNPETDEWATWFTGIYTRQEPEAPEAASAPD
jgi:hypothetical protein